MNKKVMRSTSACIALSVALLGCHDNDLLYYYTPQAEPQVQITKSLSEIIRGGSLDIVWVIDNSGSMNTYQQEVIKNTDLFMNEFTKISGIDWKMGLLSSDSDSYTRKNPYIGFKPNEPLNSTMPNAIKLFKAAVNSLGVFGSGTETFFQPVVTLLTQYPSFVSSLKSQLAVIFVTDAKEQSETSYTPQYFLDFLKGIKKGDLSKVTVYGAFAADDFGCDSEEGKWDYAGSPYEKVITATKGKAVKLCDYQFGKALATIGNDLAQKVTRYRIPIAARPRLGTIKVSYHDKPLQGGAQDKGGIWYYDYDMSSIVFYNLDFLDANSSADTENVDVSYTADSGIDLPGVAGP